MRVAVIGVGGMGEAHVESATLLDETQLVGVCDIVEETAQRIGEKYSAPWFTDYRRMYRKAKPEMVVVATPHPLHVKPAIDAMKRGIHVLCEKPIASTVSDGDKMIAAAEEHGVTFGVMFQNRTSSFFSTAKRILDSGRLGPITRVDMIASGFRTQVYYDRGAWRGKWSSEGGGVLLNQAPHDLDILCWLAGPLRKVRGWITTRIHDIPVEDTAYAYLEFENGAQGLLHASTSEVPGTSRIEICCDGGKLLLQGEPLRMAVCNPPTSKFSKETPEAWSSPNVEWQDVELPEVDSGHKAVVADMARAIREGRPPVAPGNEALWSLELANAIILSSPTGKDVELPISRSQYNRCLKKLIAETEG